MKDVKKIWQEKNDRIVVFFAIFTLFITPIITVFFVPPDSQLPIYASAVVTMFWVVVLCVFFWNMVIGIAIERHKRMEEIEVSIKNQKSDTVKMKHGMVADLKLLKPSHHEDLMWALAFAVDGDKKALKKMNNRANWAAIKMVTWVSILLILIPFVALGFIHPYIIIGWIALVFLYLPYSSIRDLLLNNEYVYESLAMGLTFDKSTQIASGVRYGRKVKIHFKDHGCKTTIKAATEPFQAVVKKREFEAESTPREVKKLLEKLSNKKRASLWYRTEIKANGKEIECDRTYSQNSENTVEAGYWLCDLWLAEWLASGKIYE